MRKYSKLVVVVFVVCCMMFSLVSFASAATYKDGSYSVETTPDKSTFAYTLSVTVSDGKITEAKFTAKANGVEANQDAVDKTSEGLKAGYQEFVDELQAYGKELVKIGDGSKVSDLTDTKKLGMWAKIVGPYGKFVEAWTEIAKQAFVADAPATAVDTKADASENPKTGDSGVVIFVVAAIAALSAIVLLGKKHKVTE